MTQRAALSEANIHRAIVYGLLAIYLLAVVMVFGTLLFVAPHFALLAGVLYLLSHVLRAMRLAALSSDMLGTSARTVLSLHFATAPFALMLPLKLGELVRYYALWRTSRRAFYALIVLLIERMFDSLFLIPIVLYLTLSDNASMVLVTLTVLMAAFPLAVIVIGPKVLVELQRYIVLSKDSPFSERTLRRIDALRRLVQQAAQVAARQWAPLSAVSFLIWTCEVLFCVVLVQGAFTLMAEPFALLGDRLVTFWGAAPANTLAATGLTITLVAQLVPWPFMAFAFLRRYDAEPQNHMRQSTLKQ